MICPGDVQNGKTTNGIHLPASHIRFAGSQIYSRWFHLDPSTLADRLTCCCCLDCCFVLFSAELPPHLEKIKQQANDAFARQQWTQAIQLYSLGIHQASCNAMLYGNRAAAYMKRKWWELVCFNQLSPTGGVSGLSSSSFYFFLKNQVATQILFHDAFSIFL